MAHEFDGKKYEKASGHQKEWGEKLIGELGLRGTERILDLGCGDGTLTVQLSELVPKGKVVGVDASQGMIETAKHKRRRNLHFLLMDVDSLDFVEEFDVVFSNATLHWVSDHRRLLSNVLRALRPDGVARFNFAGDGNCFHFFKVIRESMGLVSFARYFEDFLWPWYMPSVEEYRVLVEDSGFGCAKVWGENADRFFPDAEALV
jgi:trans-aconitate 2-methyltransferase